MLLSLGSSEPQGSAKGCQGLQETKMRNGGRILLVVLKLYVRIEIHVTTFDANHSVTQSTQTANHCFHPEATRSCSEVNQHSPP